ncbi:hypothetical protein [Paenibacillus protaetiae]|uniref:hypothetical protein n=1 Tax=Paenibacillus protaetiae TaxID=2509456 RepID=UPI0013EDA70E|nr:hypothetical protein [Paenibacillus protaetiae]
MREEIIGQQHKDRITTDTVELKVEDILSHLNISLDQWRQSETKNSDLKSYKQA